MENKYKNSAKKKTAFADKNNKQTRSRVLSLAQLLSRVRQLRKQRGFSGLVRIQQSPKCLFQDQGLFRKHLLEIQ